MPTWQEHMVCLRYIAPMKSFKLFHPFIYNRYFWHQTLFSFYIYKVSILVIKSLTHSFPIHPFSIPWEHFFKGWRKCALGTNGLIQNAYSLKKDSFSFYYSVLKRLNIILKHIYSKKVLQTEPYFRVTTKYTSRLTVLIQEVLLGQCLLT